MKKITPWLILTLATLSSFGQEISKNYSKDSATFFGKKVNESSITPSGHIRCVSSEYEQYLQEQNPKRLNDLQFEEWIGILIEEQRQLQEVASQSGGIIYIPVVVHVIHNGDDYGVNENITDEQVESQITVMTQDYRKMIGTPGYNTNAVGADVQIEFVLAKVDPNGNPTNGMNRVNLCEASWSTSDIESVVKPNTIWDPTQYMNMWSVNFSSSSLLGYAQFPSSSGLSGLNTNMGSANTDGVVAGYRFFGSSDLTAGTFTAPFDKGRTMTHEVGHFLGLRHIWGDGNCTVDDYCADTPVSNDANVGCPSGTDSCPTLSGLDMIENYMDYTNDACMNIFTINQKARITTVMNNSPRRASLKNSTKDIAITLFTNDAEVIIDNYCTSTASCSNFHNVLLYNRGTANLTSATLTYSVNGGNSSTYNWSGTLAPNKYEIINLSTTEMTGTFNVSISSINGTTDQRTSNNSDSKSFTFNYPTDYPYTTFNFNLIQDDYGSETTWTLVNSSGTVVYSGGPYTDNQDGVIAENTSWTLSPDCYTFTINDDYGDGICCDFGNGSYSITANSGNVTIASGGSFATSESVSFSNASLNTSSFDLESITMYPNPSKDVLNIVVPSTLGNTISYEIFNNLGQVVSSGKNMQNNFTVNTSSYSAGVYFIKLNVENASKVLRLSNNNFII